MVVPGLLDPVRWHEVDPLARKIQTPFIGEHNMLKPSLICARWEQHDPMMGRRLRLLNEVRDHRIRRIAPPRCIPRPRECIILSGEKLTAFCVACRCGDIKSQVKPVDPEFCNLWWC